MVDTSPWFLELHARMAMEKRKKPTFVEEGAGLARVLLEQRDSLKEVVRVRAEYVSMLEGSLRGTVASLGRIQTKREALEEDIVTARGMAKEAVDALERIEAMLVIRGDDAKVESKLQVDSICGHEGACGCVLPRRHSGWRCGQAPCALGGCTSVLRCQGLPSGRGRGWCPLPCHTRAPCGGGPSRP